MEIGDLPEARLRILGEDVQPTTRAWEQAMKRKRERERERERESERVFVFKEKNK
jgi:hypothetical protein